VPRKRDKTIWEVSVNSRNQSYVIYLLLFIAIIAMLVYNFSQQGNQPGCKTINEVAADVQSGQVTVLLKMKTAPVIYPTMVHTRESNIESNATLVQQLLDLGVQPAAMASDRMLKIEIKPPAPGWASSPRLAISCRS
jgi:cell division protease FtsH